MLHDGIVLCRKLMSFCITAPVAVTYAISPCRSCRNYQFQFLASVLASASLAPLSSLLACSNVVACVCLLRAANCSPNLPFPEPLCARSYSAYYQRSFSEPLSTFLHFIQSHLRFPLKQVLGLPTSAALAAAVLGSSTPLLRQQLRLLLLRSFPALVFGVVAL